MLKYLIPFLLPLVGFVVWAWLASRKDGEMMKRISSGPWFWAVVAGLILGVSVLGLVAFTEGGAPGSKIIAPRFEDGKVVPAEIR